MPIQLSGSLVITGSITTTGVITMSGSIASASYSSTSDLLQGTGSVGFATTASLLEVSSSQQQISASYIALSASYNTFSGSASTRITVDSASLLQVSASQQQISASLLNVISIFATTGSNSFRANQSITGSLVVSSTITAQTLIVQTVTSSIVYSSGSNIFGCDLNSRQTFTGSVLITGSLTIAGASSAASYSGTTIFGSTIACSPIGCFATSCATSFIGGTMSGTTIYGSTAVCSPVGKFTSCIDIGGTGTFSSSVTATQGFFTATANTYAGGALKLTSFTGGTNIYLTSVSGIFALSNGGSADHLTIASTGAATFSSSVIAANYRSNGRIFVTDEASYGDMTSTAGMVSIGYYPTGQEATIRSRNYSTSTNTKLAFDASQYTFGGGNVGINCSAPSGKLQVANSSTQYALYTTNGNLELYTPEGNCGYVRLGSAYNLNGVYGGCGLNYLAAGTSNHVFYTTDGPTERMRISCAGIMYAKCAINLTDVVCQSDADTWPVLNLSGANGTSGITNTSSPFDWGFIKGSTARGYYSRQVGALHMSSAYDMGFYTSGWVAQFVMKGSDGNAYLRGTLTQGSDCRIKTNICNLNYGISEIMQLRPISYNRKTFERDTCGNILSEGVDMCNKYIGFIAQEVKPLIPEVVNGNENSENPEQGLSIEYQNMTALLVKGMQEQQCTINTLKTCLGIS